MKNNYIEFSLSVPAEMTALAAFLAQLNREGIPYSVTKDAIAIMVTLSGSY